MEIRVKGKKNKTLFIQIEKPDRVFECKSKSPASFQDQVAAKEVPPFLDHCKYMKVKLPPNRLTHHRYPSTWASIGLVGILELVKEVQIWEATKYLNFSQEK